MKFTKDTTLAAVLEDSKNQEIMAKYKVPCLGCSFMTMEMDKLTLGDICKTYGINLAKLLKELNSTGVKKAVKAKR